jgi:hypothetical protein
LFLYINKKISYTLVVVVSIIRYIIMVLRFVMLRVCGGDVLIYVDYQ